MLVLSGLKNFELVNLNFEISQYKVILIVVIFCETQFDDSIKK